MSDSALRARKLLLAFLPDPHAGWLQYDFWQDPEQYTRIAPTLSRYLWAAVVFYFTSLFLLRLVFPQPAKTQRTEDKENEEKRDRPSVTLMLWNCLMAFVAVTAIDAVVSMGPWHHTETRVHLCGEEGSICAGGNYDKLCASRQSADC